MMERIFTMEIYQTDDALMKNTSAGEILISSTTGGHFSGKKMNGDVVPIGIGCTFTPVAGKNDIDARLLLHTDDNANILMSMKAHFDIDPATEKKLMSGEYINPEDYYYKGVVDFKTDNKKYKWLERKICVCSGIVESWEKLTFSIMLL